MSGDPRGSTPNAYSLEWYEIFLDPIAAGATAVEIGFVERQLPVASFPTVLDLCCGPARHAALLAERGYRIVGVDQNEDAIGRARGTCPTGVFEVADMRQLRRLSRTFDGVVNLWHSFGYFDDDTNLDLLRQVRDILWPKGRAIFDIYNREHIERLPLEDVSERSGHRVRTRRTWNGPRHRVELEYDGRKADEFEWRLYSPAEFRELCASAGLETLLQAAWFDESLAPSAEHARMQFVLERVG